MNLKIPSALDMQRVLENLLEATGRELTYEEFVVYTKTYLEVRNLERYFESERYKILAGTVNTALYKADVVKTPAAPEKLPMETKRTPNQGAAGQWAVTVEHPEFFKRAVTTKPSDDEKQAGPRELPRIGERADPDELPRIGERADPDELPGSTQRAVGLESTLIPQRADQQEPPVEVERAVPTEIPANLERAVYHETPDTTQRADSDELPGSIQRAGPTKTPELLKRAVNTETSGSNKRADSAEPPVTTKRPRGRPKKPPVGFKDLPKVLLDPEPVNKKVLDLEKYPVDPMPHHTDVHKLLIMGVEKLYECDECGKSRLTMCLPSRPDSEGKLKASYKCLDCKHESIFDISQQDSDELLKEGITLESFLPGSVYPPELVGPAKTPISTERAAQDLSVALEEELKLREPRALPMKQAATIQSPINSERAVQAQIPEPTERATQVKISVPVERTVQTKPPVSSKCSFDTEKLMQEIAGDEYRPEVNMDLMVTELEEAVRTWPLEKIVLEWERVTKQNAPKENLANFVQAEMIPLVAKHMAGLVLSF